MNEDFIINIIKKDSWKMDVLRTARTLNLPDWLIGAGFVRNPVWDALHNFKDKPHMTDIDVIYFDPNDLSEETEKKYESILSEKLDADWSVKNQARMGKINNQVVDYISSTDAIAHWPETATAIGVAMLPDDSLKIVAPHGLDDLFSLKLRMTPNFGDGHDYFINRINKKQWLLEWPKLQIVD